jgi:hypothetical protein
MIEPQRRGPIITAVMIEPRPELLSTLYPYGSLGQAVSHENHFREILGLVWM